MKESRSLRWTTASCSCGLQAGEADGEAFCAWGSAFLFFHLQAAGVTCSAQLQRHVSRTAQICSRHSCRSALTDTCGHWVTAGGGVVTQPAAHCDKDALLWWSLKHTHTRPTSPLHLAVAFTSFIFPSISSLSHHFIPQLPFIPLSASARLSPHPLHICCHSDHEPPIFLLISSSLFSCMFSGLGSRWWWWVSPQKDADWWFV